MARFLKSLSGLALTIVASFVMIFLGIIYFMLTLWMIKIGALWAKVGVDGNMVLLTAGIVSAAAIIASAIQK